MASFITSSMIIELATGNVVNIQKVGAERRIRRMILFTQSALEGNTAFVLYVLIHIAF